MSALQAYGIALVIGLIVSLIICSAYKSQMKTAVMQRDADNYAKGQMNFTERVDNYTHTTKTERKISNGNSAPAPGGPQGPGPKH